MHSGIILLALVAAAAGAPSLKAADQDLLKKQQDTIHLLDNILQELPNQELYDLGYNYDILSNVGGYHEPAVVQYYAGMVNAGQTQPQGTVYSSSVSQLRKEVALLTRILLGAKDYSVFLKTAAWARVFVNQGQFVKAYISAILQREDTQGVIPPPLYEIHPHLYIDARVIHEAKTIKAKGLQGVGHNVIIPVNYTDNLPMGEHKLNYFYTDIGLNAYHAYISLAGYMIPEHQQQQGYQHGHSVQYEQGGHHIGRGSRFYYLHQQLLAHYNLERLANGLGPIENVDWQTIKAPFHPHLHYSNGLEFPGRPSELHLTHHHKALVKNVRALEQRLLEAIDSGHVITPQQRFLSLYQPQGLNILGDLIEGTGRSVNPRYYGSLQGVARQLFGNTPRFENIWSYTPSALELSETCVRDPAFYQLYKRVIDLFLRYQESLPAYQYDDLVLPGVKIEQVNFPNLVTYFDQFYVDLDSSIVHPRNAQEQLENTHKIKAQLERLNHQQYQYQIDVTSEQIHNNAVVRVYLGPKVNYDGQPIDINRHRHYFVELDQFVHDLQQGKNVIVRNSHQTPIHSGDYPSASQIKVHVDSAIRSQNPYYIHEPQHIFGFPARLAIPKGTHGGYPLQVVVVISSSEHRDVPYGPIIPKEYQTYQQHQFQIVNQDQYQQYVQQTHQQQQQQQQGLHHGGYQTVEVIPDYQGHGIYGNQVHKHLSYYGNYLYKKYPSLFIHQHQYQGYGQGVGQTGGYGYGHQQQQQGYYGQQGQWMHQGQVHQGHLHQGQGPQGLSHGQTGHVHQGQQYQGQVHQGQQYQGQVHHGQHYQGQGHQGQQYQGQVHQGQIHQGQVHQGQQYQGQPITQGEILEQGQEGIVEGVVGVGQGVRGGVGQGVHGGVGQGVHGGVGQGVHGGVYQGQGVHSGIGGGMYQGGIQGGHQWGQGQRYQGAEQNFYGQRREQSTHLQQYYNGKHISQIIGGAISLDNKPLGYPLNRPLAPSAFYVPNIKVVDVLVYHNDYHHTQQGTY